MDSLQKLELFFKYDMEIKNILYGIQVDESDKYNRESLDSKRDKIYNSLKDLRWYFKDISNKFMLSLDKRIDDLFDSYVEKLYKCTSNNLNRYYNNMFIFCNDYLTDLDSSFVRAVGENSIGYSAYSPISCMSKVKTVNELLHMIHMHITNDLSTYNSINLLDSKENSIGYDINLRGRVNDIGLSIFKSIPLSLPCGDMDIISFSSNKVLIMVRDMGHALVLDILKNGDHCEVKYHIPKICNVSMVQKLKGLGTKVTSESIYAFGYFEVPIDKIGEEVSNFISMVPTDVDMVFNEESKKTR